MQWMMLFLDFLLVTILMACLRTLGCRNLNFLTQSSTFLPQNPFSIRYFISQSGLRNMPYVGQGHYLLNGGCFILETMSFPLFLLKYHIFSSFLYCFLLTSLPNFHPIFDFLLITNIQRLMISNQWRVDVKGNVNIHRGSILGSIFSHPFFCLFHISAITEDQKYMITFIHLKFQIVQILSIINDCPYYNNFQQQYPSCSKRTKSNADQNMHMQPKSQIRECVTCANCRSWQQKTQDLIWGYDQLLSAKEKEIQTLGQVIYQLEQRHRKATSKLETLTRKLQAYENQMDKIKGSRSNNQEVISYYKERQTELLSQMKTIQNELFYKNVQIKDELDSKEDRVLSDILTNENKQNKQNQHKMTLHSRSQASLIPIIQTSQTLGKMLQRNLCDLQKMSQEKMMLEVKHRMAVLRAAQLSVLK